MVLTALAVTAAAVLGLTVVAIFGKVRAWVWLGGTLADAFAALPPKTSQPAVFLVSS